MEYLRKLEQDVAARQNISVRPHRFGGMEFLFESAEVGHTHEGGIVDIPFPRAVRNVLLAAGLAEQHHWVPNSLHRAAIVFALTALSTVPDVERYADFADLEFAASPKIPLHFNTHLGEFVPKPASSVGRASWRFPPLQWNGMAGRRKCSIRLLRRSARA
jgi:hypothetical protein